MADSIETMLEQLHRETAKRLLERIRAADATAADFQAARAFLKDNEIQSVPNANRHLEDLSNTLGDVDLDEPGSFPIGGTV